MRRWIKNCLVWINYPPKNLWRFVWYSTGVRHANGYQKYFRDTAKVIVHNFNYGIFSISLGATPCIYTLTLFLPKTSIVTVESSLRPPSLAALQVKLFLVSSETELIVQFEVVVSRTRRYPRYHKYVTLSGLPGWSMLHSNVTDPFLITLEGAYRNLAGLGGSTRNKQCSV